MAKRKLRKIDDEIWKEIPFADKKYEISNYGRIKSYCYDKINGRIVKPGNVKGFLNVSIRTKGKKKSYLVHKLVAILFVPKKYDGEDIVIHLDWNKKNNYYKNLKWVTKNDSYKRMFKKFQEDRKKQGKRVTNSKLTKEDVGWIKSMLKKGIKQSVIAKLFCVSEMQITRIKRNENWAEIPPAGE